MNDKSSLERVMSASLEAQSLVRRIAEPCPAGDSVKAAIGRAARKLRLNYARCRAFWYADDRIKVTGDELNQLRAVAKQHTAGADTHDVLARLDKLENMVESLVRVLPHDPDYYGPQLDTLRSAMRAYRGSYSP